MKRNATRWLPALLALTLACWATAALAQVRPATRPKPTTKPGEVSVTGPVKGAPTGKTFVIARKGGDTTVDATKAQIRQGGKFASFNDIKAGLMVTAKGTMQGTTLMATEVTLHPRAPKPPAGTTPPAPPRH
jgi:hypothetical protein